MPEPTIYFDVVFFVLLIYVIREGYWRGLLKNLIFEIKSRYKLGFTILIIAIFSILFFDLPISYYFSHNDKFQFLHSFISTINNFGNANILFSILGVLLIISYFYDSQKYKYLFSISLSSSVFAGLINLLLKMVITRERPYIDLSPYSFFDYIEAFKNGSLFHVDYLSMPSGHTIVIFAAMIPLFFFFKNKFIKYIFVLLPVLVGIARIYLFRHWLSDVIMAAFLGTMIGIAAYKVNIERKVIP